MAVRRKLLPLGGNSADRTMRKWSTFCSEALGEETVRLGLKPVQELEGVQLTRDTVARDADLESGAHAAQALPSAALGQPRRAE